MLRATRSEKSLRLTSGVCVVGAGASVDFGLEDETVSRQHIELELIPEGLRVRDLDSRNGTFYNGHRIETLVLAGGATLRLGRAELQIEFDTSALYAAEGEASYGGLVAASPVMKRQSPACQSVGSLSR